MITTIILTLVNHDRYFLHDVSLYVDDDDGERYLAHEFYRYFVLGKRCGGATDLHLELKQLLLCFVTGTKDRDC